MSEAFEALLVDGVAPWRNPWSRRADALRELPAIVAARLTLGASRADTMEWSARLERHFADLSRDRDGRWTRGWDALGGGLAAAIGLLRQEVSPAIREALAASEALSQQVAAATEGFERFVPVLGDEVHLLRALRGEDGEVHLIDRDGARTVHRGRSQELMSTLLTAGDLESERGKVVATGAVAPGGSLQPVQRLGAKVEAARRADAALILTCAPRSLDKDDVLAALNAGSAEGYFSLRGVEDDPAWLVAGSLTELRWKLGRLRDGDRVVADGWNGAALSRRDIVTLPVHRAVGSGRHDRDASLGDDLFDAIWGAVQGDYPGVLVEGSPGAGKSVWSAELVARFSAAPLGLLGSAVRAKARDLAQGLSSLDDLAGLVDATGETADLIEALSATNRLVLVVDGLDELHADDLAGVARFLAERPFVATSRPNDRVRSVFSASARLTLGGLDAGQAAALLGRRGRSDLAKRLFTERRGGQIQGPQRPELAALCSSPFQLTLLSEVLSTDEDPRQMTGAELYRRAWALLVDAALRDQRLPRDQADLLRRRLVSLVGELALAALHSSDGKVSRPMLEVHLEDLGFRGRDALDVERALEWGYLLAPGGEDWDFAHRSIAEWAAASAILHRAGLVIERRRRSGQVLDQAQEASVEIATIREALGDERLWAMSQWGQVLRFLSGRVKSPAALLRLLLEGVPEDVEETELLSEWALAVSLASEASWAKDEARWAWGLLAREQVLRPTVGLRAHHPPAGAFPEHPDLVLRLSDSLPKTLDELLELAAMTPAQRSRLQDDLPALLRVCGPAQSWLAELALKQGDPASQIDVLTWHRRWREHLGEDDRRRYDCYLPLGWSEATARHLERQKPEHGDNEAVRRLEAAIYEHGSVPFEVRRSRMRAWPAHLTRHLTAWFEWDSGFGHGSEERAEALQVVASSLAGSQDELSSLLAELCTSAGGLVVVGVAHRGLDSRDERTVRAALIRRLEQLGAADADLWELAKDADEDARRAGLELLGTLRGVERRKFGLKTVVAKLTESPTGASEVARVWALFPDSTARRALTTALAACRRLPDPIPVSALVEVLDDDFVRFDRAWITETPWSAEQERAWRSLARAGGGRARGIARLWVAARDETDVIRALVENVDDSDEEYIEFATRALEGTYCEPECDLPAWAPLKLRAARGMPGWDGEVLSELAGTPEPERVETLARLASEHGLTAAAPLLVRHAARIEERWTRERVVAAAQALGADRATIEKTIPPDPDRKVPDGLLQRATLEDLEVILTAPSLGYGGEKALAEAIGRMGVKAHDPTLEALALRRAELSRLEKTDKEESASSNTSWETVNTRRSGVYEVEKWLEALSEAAVRTFDPGGRSLDELVSLGFTVFGGDDIEIGAMRGPLGADFDEPEDLEYSSELKGASAIRRYMGIVRSKAAEAQDLNPLRRLLEHPSETIQLASYEVLVERTPAHALADLAVDALSAHARNTRRSYSGRVHAWRLAMLAGTGAVDLPETGRKLAAGVRRHLTSAHRPVLEKMTTSELPGLRLLGARWTGELAPQGATDLLRPLLADACGPVVAEAVRAWCSLGEDGLPEALGSADRTAWSEASFGAAIHALLFRRVDDLFQTHLERREIEPETAQLVHRLLEEGVGVVEAGDEAGNPLVVGSPSLLEEAVGALEEVAPLAPETLASWLRRATTPARPALRRSLVAMGRRDLVPDLLELLTIDEREQRSSAVECLIASGHVEDVEGVLEAFWATCMNWSPERVLWALDRAPVKYVGIAVEALSRVHEDDSGMPIEGWIGRRVWRRMRQLGPEALSVVVATADSKRRHLRLASWDLRREFEERPEALPFLGELPRPEYSLAAELWEELTGERARSDDRAVLRWFRTEVLGSRGYPLLPAADPVGAP